MRFATPHMLWLLLLVPIAAAFMIWAFGRRAALLKRFASDKALLRYDMAATTVLSWVRMGLVLLGLTAIVIALARPQWGYHEQRIISRGVDMMIAIDTSDSMMARDFQPDRLTRAKELLRNMIWEAQGARVGVVAFAGAAAVMSPLTLDYNMAATALKAVDVNTISAGGTNIGAAVKAALGSFEISGGNDRILILLTDGEQTEKLEDLNDAVAKAAEEGIKIFAIGIGAEEGSPIPTMRGFKRDSAGQVITTRLDFKKLQEIAEKTKGQAIRAEKMGAGEIAEISAALAQFKGQKQQDKTVRIYHDRYPWFVGAAFICFLLEALFSSLKRLQWRPRRTSRSVAQAALLMLSIIPLRNLDAYPGEGYIRSREAYQEYSAGDYEDAVLQYQRAAQLAPQDPRRLYNLGATAAKAGKEEEARNALRSVFDAENPSLNANALYSAATLDHRDLRDSIKSKKPDWEGALQAAPDKIEPVKKEIQETITKLDKIIGEYKDAILSKPDDMDMKANFELAKKDKSELEKLLEQLNQQQQQQQQQEQPQQNQQQQEQQQNQQNQQSGQNQQDQQGKQGENQEQQDQEGQQDKDQQKDQPDQQEGQEEQKQPDQQGQEQKEQQGEQQQEQNQQGQQGEQEQQQKQPDPKGTPAPTPTPSPTPSQTPRSGENQGQQGQSGQEAPPVPVGQMSPTDVDRLLNTLPPEDQQALQLMFGTDPNPQDEMQNDW